jgi:hypothetical protein
MTYQARKEERGRRKEEREGRREEGGKSEEYLYRFSHYNDLLSQE